MSILIATQPEGALTNLSIAQMEAMKGKSKMRVKKKTARDQGPLEGPQDEASEYDTDDDDEGSHSSESDDDPGMKAAHSEGEGGVLTLLGPDQGNPSGG